MALQDAALPSSSKAVQPRLGQEVGQLVRGSHCSAPSSTPLPHWGSQSTSLAPVQPAGQQPSLTSRSQALPHFAAAPPDGVDVAGSVATASAGPPASSDARPC